MSKFVVGAAALVVLCSGCASITQGTTHSLRIDTETAQGQVVDGADCSLSNDQGTSIARSGSATIVRRSSKDLEIRCTSAGQPDATARLVSRANAGLAGNILFGGAIGAALDHGSGAAYTYPTWIKLVFGEYAVLDRRDEREGTALAASAGAATVVTQSTAAMPAPAVVPAVAVVPPAATAATATVVLATTARHDAPLVRGDTFDYQLVDRTTQAVRTVMLRVDRTDDRQVLFNGGTRVEKPNGELVTRGPSVLGELDDVTPAGGWLPSGRVPRGVWPVKFITGAGADRRSYDLTAQAGGEQMIRIKAGQFRAVRIDIEGWYTYGTTGSPAPYRAVLWVSPDLRRPIRFEVKSRSVTNLGSAFFMIDETAELTAITRN
jgi:hypothetical protein